MADAERALLRRILDEARSVWLTIDDEPHPRGDGEYQVGIETGLFEVTPEERALMVEILAELPPVNDD